ncbi:MAG: DUF2442 domain-containing protein [Chitinophagaceae bacterium]
METISIIKAQYTGNLSVKIWFDDDSVQTVNIGSFIQKHPQYNKYLDEKYFKKFKIENGNVVWGSNWDLVFPLEQLHEGKILECSCSFGIYHNIKDKHNSQKRISSRKGLFNRLCGKDKIPNLKKFGSQITQIFTDIFICGHLCHL